MSVVPAAMLVAACGGGGGVNSGGSTAPPAAAQTPTPTPTPTPAQPPTSASSAEYQASGAVVVAKAAYAYDRGITGKGVTIAIVDTGIDTSGREFAGRISADSTSFDQTIARCATCAPETIRFGVKDVVGHGTRVAGIAAAARDDAGVPRPVVATAVAACSRHRLDAGVVRPRDRRAGDEQCGRGPDAPCPRRELDLEIGWTATLSPSSSLRLGVARAFDAGHVAGATDTAGFLTLALN